MISSLLNRYFAVPKKEKMVVLTSLCFKEQDGCSFKHRTMFRDKFVKSHWLVPRDFLDHLIGARENTCRMILRDFKEEGSGGGG